MNPGEDGQWHDERSENTMILQLDLNGLEVKQVKKSVTFIVVSGSGLCSSRAIRCRASSRRLYCC